MIRGFSSILVVSFMALAFCGAAWADSYVLIDASNYPQLPKAFGGAELVSDYAKTRLVDVAFHGATSSVNIRAKQGEIPGDIALWAREGVTLKAKADADGHLKLRLTSNGETGIAWLELKYLQPTGMCIFVK